MEDVKPLSPDDLAAHAAWMRRLAAAIAGPAGDADDLVQDAFVSALRAPPDADRPARPWLAEVLRNAARMRRRGDGRRSARESGVATDERGRAAPAPDELLERAEAHRHLANLVVALDEPLRRTLLLRYFEDVPAARIAELEGVAIGTVRWRLSEGIERLRAGMDREAGERRRWMRALASPLTGVAIMKAKTKIGIAAALLLGAGTAAVVVVKTRGGGGDGASPTSASAAGPPPVAGPARAGAPGADRDAAEPPDAPDARPLALVAARAEVDPSARHGVVEGRVVNWGSGAPVAAADVTLALPDGATTSLPTDRDGRFRFAPDRPQRVTIASITAAGYLPFAPEWGHSPIELVARPGIRVRDVVVYLTPAIDYTGVVVAADGTPVAGAEVRLIDLPAAEQEIVSIEDRFTTDRKGEFVFHAPDDALLEARAAGHGPGRARLDGAAQTSHRLTIELATAGAAQELGSATLTGIVVDAGGDPVPGAIVRAEPVRRGPRGPHGDAHLTAGGRAAAGDDGRFVIAGLDPGPHVALASDRERAPASAEVTLVARSRADVRLALAVGAVLHGVVRDAGGEPVAASSIVVSQMDGLRGRVVAVRTVIDREGTFAIDGLAPGEYRVQATAHGHAPSGPGSGIAELPPARGRPALLTLPAGGTLTGTVRSADGDPIENARVSVEGGIGEGPSPIPFAASATTDKAGAFALRGLAPGRRSVVVGAFDHHGTILSGLEVADGAQIGPIEVTLTPVAEGEQPTLELAGIGIQVAPGTDALLVEGVLPGGGAEQAGLAAGDAILSVDGAAVTQLGFDTAIQAIRGPVGTVVRLTVRKAGETSTRELRVERRKIRA